MQQHTLIVLELKIFPKKIRKIIENIITNIFKVQAFDWIMCEYLWIRFIDFMLRGKSLLEYPNLFFPNEY